MTELVPTSDIKFAGLRWKRVMRWDADLKMLRVGRVMWEGRSKRGHEIGHKLSLALWPKLFRFRIDMVELDVMVLGIRVHHISGGGRYV